MFSASLSGNGKLNSDSLGVGSIKTGDIIGVHVDMGVDRFVRFFVNGEQYGMGFAGEDVAGPLLLGVQMAFAGQMATCLFSEVTRHGSEKCGRMKLT